MPTVNVNPFNSGANYALGSCTVSGGGVNSTIAFNNARGASSGTVNQTSTATPTSVQVSMAIGGRGTTITISRSFAWFDLSAYASSTSVNSGVATDFVVAKSVNAFSSATTTTLASGDYNSVFFNTLYSSANLSWATSGTSINSPLNSSAVNDANTNGKLNIVWLNDTYDQNNSAPSSGFSFTGINHIDQANPGKIALFVTYSLPGYQRDVNTVTSAEIVQVNTVATADIVEINTVGN
jgi:hypothetical protein